MGEGGISVYINYKIFEDKWKFSSIYFFFFALFFLKYLNINVFIWNILVFSILLMWNLSSWATFHVTSGTKQVDSVFRSCRDYPKNGCSENDGFVTCTYSCLGSLCNNISVGTDHVTFCDNFDCSKTTTQNLSILVVIVCAFASLLGWFLIFCPGFAKFVS